MRAAVMEAVRQPLQVRDVPDPTPPPHGVVVRVEANGICRTDWHLWTGDWTWLGIALPLPHVLGHEFCGVVEEAGPEVTRWKKGDRVLVPFSLGEGTCEWCRSGHHNVCDTILTPGVVSWGGYGRYAPVPHADVNLVPLPATIDFVEAASMGCRYMTSFHALVDQGAVRGGEWVAVHGCGGVGLSAVQIASALGASVVAVDVDDRKLAAAKAEGAVATVNASREDAARAGLERGRHVQVGLTTQAEKGEIPLPIDLVVLKEVTIVGSLGMQAPRFSAMLRMVESGRLAPGRLVQRRVALEEAGGVLRAMDDFGTVGVVVIDRY
jgi:D-arabinose 1-dehydrogenase-like Zn-dependent alcohol dehydrogenase